MKDYVEKLSEISEELTDMLSTLNDYHESSNFYKPKYSKINSGESSSVFRDINKNNEKDINPFGKSNNDMFFNFDYSFLRSSNSKKDLIREIKNLHKKVDRWIEENKNLTDKELLKNKSDKKAESLIDKYEKIEEKFNSIIKTNNKKSDDNELIFKLEL